MGITKGPFHQTLTGGGGNCMVIACKLLCRLQNLMLTVKTCFPLQTCHISIFYIFITLGFLPLCMECRRGLAMRILSIRLSVCPSVCHTRAL